tara:strand:- start:16 stop:741 length:726 start_codon:yes stop_codon:yes gene_type:complete
MIKKQAIARGLIVDDDKRAHEILSEGLDDFSFHSTYGINDTLDMLNKHQYSFVLLDYRLGAKQNGLYLVDAIRKTNPMAIIFLISAYGTTFVLKEAIESSIDSYLDKPIILDEYREKIITLLKKHGLIQSMSMSDSIVSIESNIQSKGAELSNIKLKDIANHTNKSYKYLSQKFKKQTGKTFQQLKKDEKYNHIKHLLSNTNLSIKEISEQCGFNHPSAIMRGFKDFTGQTMTEYRNKTKL